MLVMKRILSLLAVLLFVVGCGGGSGSDSNIQSTQEPSCPENVDGFSYQDQSSWQYVEELCDNGSVVSYSCQRENGGIVAFGGNLDGVCEYLHEQKTNPQPMEKTGFEACPSPDELTKFVNTFDPVNRFDSAPVLSFADSSTEYHKQLARESVSLLNRALPDEYDITESGVDVEGSDGGALQVPEGEIYIQFFPEQPNVPVGLAVGRYIRITGGAEHEIGRSSALRKSYVLFIAHEIMHVLGFSGHIDLPTNSIMMDGFYIIDRFVTDREWPREEILSAVDVWGIRYFYEDATGDPEEWLENRCQ